MKEQFIWSVAKFRVKIKSLAHEAKVIRSEEHRCKRIPWIAGSLQFHRKVTVRVEQRHTLLAYGFLRGVTYSTIEQNAATMPDVKRIDRILKSLTFVSQPDAVKEWIDTSRKSEAA